MAKSNVPPIVRDAIKGAGSILLLVAYEFEPRGCVETRKYSQLACVTSLAAHA
jgi:hypothetical protein